MQTTSICGSLKNICLRPHLIKSCFCIIKCVNLYCEECTTWVCYIEPYIWVMAQKIPFWVKLIRSISHSQPCIGSKRWGSATTIKISIQSDRHNWWKTENREMDSRETGCKESLHTALCKLNKDMLIIVMILVNQ